MIILDRFAETVGVDPVWRDIWGNRREASDETKRAVLAAMGFDVADEDRAAACLRDYLERPWRRMLPPVAVWLEDGPREIDIVLPAGIDAVEWRVDLEQGGEVVGRVDLRHVPAVEEREVDGERRIKRRVVIGGLDRLGYHELFVAADGLEERATVILAPDRCLGPEAIAPQGRVWGYTLQLYGLRSGRDWGMGDFTDLANFCRGAAAQGAQAVGVNPLHALFLADSRHVSPYSPSARNLLNPLYVDVETVPELAESPEAQARLATPEHQGRLRALRDADLVDHPAVAATKLEILEKLFDVFEARHLDKDTPRGRDFGAFRLAMAPHLDWLSAFDALHERFRREHGDDLWEWTNWPEPYRRYDSEETQAFIAENRRRVLFFQYLQFLADEQLAAAHRAARDAGMPLGVYRDVAVAAAPQGSQAWSGQGALARGASAGAPPDLFNPEGQGWGLAPFNPIELREQAYRPFVEMLRANMRHAGALRIDHAMSLMRLYWVPDGMSPKEGVYVRYPFEDLLRIVALESRRHRCLIVGEDLGTVPEGFRPRMHVAGGLSCRVLMFERDQDGGFLPAETYPDAALVSFSTHDLPTLAGFWAGRDVDWRYDLGFYDTEASYRRDKDIRTAECHRLLDLLIHAGLLDPHVRPDPDLPPLSVEIAVAVHRFLARTPSRLVMIQAEDAAGEVEQPNLPGATSDSHPNWRRKLRLPLEKFFGDLQVKLIADCVRGELDARR